MLIQFGEKQRTGVVAKAAGGARDGVQTIGNDGQRRRGPARRLMGAVLVLSLVASAGVPWAQEKAAPEEKKHSPAQKAAMTPVKSEVTVTATRTPIEVESSPMSTALIPRQELEQRDVRLIDKAIEDVPGVISVRFRGESDDHFGIGMRGFAGFSGQARTLILLDDQPLNDSYNGSVNWSILSPQDIDRIEIARGPFSSLYGGNAMAGVINMISRRPDGRHMDASYQYGSRATDRYAIHLTDRYFNRLGLTVGYTGFKTGGYSPQPTLITSTTSGGTAALVSGVTQWRTASGGTQYEVGRRGNEWFKSEAFRARAEYTFSPRLFGYLQYMHMRDGNDYGRYRSALRLASDGSTVDSGKYTFVDNSGVTRQFSVTPSSFMGTPVGAATNLYHAQIHAQLTPKWMLRVTTGINSNPTNWYTQAGTTSTYSGGAGTYRKQYSQAFYGNLLASRTAKKATILFGTETRSDRAHTATYSLSNFRDRTNVGALSLAAGGKTIEQAVYGQYQINFRERLNVVAGGRYDYWKTYDGNSVASADSAQQNFSDRSAQAVTGKIAANLRLPGDWHLRASIGNAFRGPSVYELYYTYVHGSGSTKYVANPDEKPEHIAAYEAGVSKTFLDRYSIEATGYTNRVTDLIYRTNDPNDATGNTKVETNAGMGRTWGTEFQAKERIVHWLNLKQGYSYTNAIILHNESLPTTEGKKIPYVPAHILSYRATATPKRFVLSWGGRYVASMYSTDANTDTVHNVPGSYDLFFNMDGTVTYEATRHVSVFVNADNMLDRHYHLYYDAIGRSVFAGVRVHF